MLKELVQMRVKPYRDRIGPKLDFFLIVLSVISVALVVINEFLPNKEFTVPGLGMAWGETQQLMRTLTWGAFLTVWLSMGLSSHRSLLWSKDPQKQSYLRKWWLEALIIVCWNPFSGGILIQQLSTLFSLQGLLLIGSAAHVARVSRFTAAKFNTHPLVTVGASMATLVTFGAVMLMIVEPQTFPSFHEAALSVYMNGLTIGGDIKPNSIIGKDLQALIATAEIGLLAVFFAVVREWVQYGIFKHDDVARILTEQVEAQSEEIKQLRHQVAEGDRKLGLLMVHLGIPTEPVDPPPGESADAPVLQSLDLPASERETADRGDKQ